MAQRSDTHKVSIPPETVILEYFSLGGRSVNEQRANCQSGSQDFRAQSVASCLEGGGAAPRTIERGFLLFLWAKLSHVCLFLGALAWPIRAAETPLTS